MSSHPKIESHNLLTGLSLQPSLKIDQKAHPAQDGSIMSFPGKKWKQFSKKKKNAFFKLNDCTT